MVQPVGPARADHRQVVGAGGNVRQPVGDPDPTLAVLLPFPLSRPGAARGSRPWAVITGLKLGGNGWPASRFSSGLGSKVSRWLGPPSMNRKITLRAVAGRRQEAEIGEREPSGSAAAARHAPASPGAQAHQSRPRPGTASRSRERSQPWAVSGQRRISNLSQRTGTHWNSGEHGRNRQGPRGRCEVRRSTGD